MNADKVQRIKKETIRKKGSKHRTSNLISCFKKDLEKEDVEAL